MSVVFSTLIYVLFCVFGVRGGDVVSVSVMEGDPVTLHTDVNRQQHEPMRWYYNDTLIALINGHPNTSCLYDGEDGIFRDRLKVDYESGSLTISDIRSEHTGRYEAELIRSESSGKRQSLNRNRKCDSTKISRKTSNADDVTIKTFSVTVSAATEQKDPKTTNEESDKDGEKKDPEKSSDLSSAAVAGIVIAVLVVFAAAAAIYYRHRH